MTDFGEAVFSLSKQLNNSVLIFHSQRQLGKVYRFYKSSEKIYYCSGCKTFGKTRGLTVINGRITGRKHPEDDHHPQCMPVNETEEDVRNIDREMRMEIRRTGKRPREAYTDAIGNINKKFKATDDKERVIAAFPSYSDIRAKLYCNLQHTRIPVPDPLLLPEELKTTLRGKNVGSDDQNFQ